GEGEGREMILNPVWIPSALRRREKAVFSLPASNDSSHNTTEQLRAQISDLHAEAEQARAKGTTFLFPFPQNPCNAISTLSLSPFLPLSFNSLHYSGFYEQS
ncbi:hypothetical protein ACLOJK_007638, partial [Asimina triloba]